MTALPRTHCAQHWQQARFQPPRFRDGPRLGLSGGVASLPARSCRASALRPRCSRRQHRRRRWRNRGTVTPATLAGWASRQATHCYRDRTATVNALRQCRRWRDGHAGHARTGSPGLTPAQGSDDAAQGHEKIRTRLRSNRKVLAQVPTRIMPPEGLPLAISVSRCELESINPGRQISCALLQ